MKTTERGLVLPVLGAPHWQPSGSPPGGLLYLAWGRREYGRHSIPLRRHEGWTYIAVLAGRPKLLLDGSLRRVRPGDLIIAGPETPYGWADCVGGKCQLLVWIWSAPPESIRQRPEKFFFLGHGAPQRIEDLTDLHRRTRREIQQSDSRSPAVLEGVRVLLDASFARSGGRETNHEHRDRQRLQMAEQWMRRHLSARAPARALADYLGISAMGLQRLFRQSAGRSPGRAFLQLKMRRATTLLARPGSSVKSVAFELGYRHVGDFSRAYAKWHGALASSVVLRKTKGLAGVRAARGSSIQA